MTSGIQFANLLELPNVEVFVVVSGFRGKRLGTVSALGCTFVDQCPFAQYGCNKPSKEDPEKVRIAVLTPRYPDSEITERTINHSWCQTFAPDLVTPPN